MKLQHKKLFGYLLIISLVIILCSCKPSTAVSQRFYFNTYCSITVYQAPENMGEIFEKVWSRMAEIEKHISRTDENSTVSALNRGENIEIDPDTAYMISLSEQFYSLTDGLFSPYLGQVIELWGIGTGDERVPSEAEIQAALAVRKYDFGAVGKGYASDEAAKILKENGIESAIINFGGNVCTVGYKKTGSFSFMKTPFTVGIRNPGSSRSDYLKVVKIHDGCVVTSGIYERAFEVDGKLYGHILNAYTGYPAESAVLSATVTGPLGSICDALSTSCYLLGPQGSEALLELFPDYSVEFVL